MATSRKSSLARSLVRSATSLGRERCRVKEKRNMRSQNYYSMHGGPRIERLADVLHVHALYSRHVSDARRNRQFRSRLCRIAGADCVCQATAPTLRFRIRGRRQNVWSRGINSLYQGRLGANADALLRLKHLCSSAIGRRGSSGNRAVQGIATDRRFRTCASRQTYSSRNGRGKARLLCDGFYQSGSASRAISVDCRRQALAAIQRVRVLGTKRASLGLAQNATIRARCKTLCQTQGGGKPVIGDYAFETAAAMQGIRTGARRQFGSLAAAKGKSRHRCHRFYRMGAAGSAASTSCVFQTSPVQTVRVNCGYRFRSDHASIRGHVGGFKITSAQVAVEADADVLGLFATEAQLPPLLAGAPRTSNWNRRPFQVVGRFPCCLSPAAAAATFDERSSRRLLIDARIGSHIGRSFAPTDATAAHSKSGILFASIVRFTMLPANACKLLPSVPSLGRGQANIPRGHNRAIDSGPAISTRHLGRLVHHVRHEWPRRDSADTNDFLRWQLKSRFAPSGWMHFASLQNLTARQAALPRGTMRREPAAPLAEAASDTIEGLASERRLRRATYVTVAGPASTAQLLPLLRLRPIAEASALLARTNSRLGSCVRARVTQAHRENTIRDTRPATVYCSWPVPPLVVGLITKGVRIRQTNGDEAMARMLCPPEAGVAREKAFAMFTEQADRADV